MDPTVMAALITAAGAERERLERRVVSLEGEVVRLRAALAAILHAAGSAIAPDETPMLRGDRD